MSASLPLPPWYSPGPALPQKSPLANEAIYGLVLKAVEARALRNDMRIVNLRPWEREIVLTPADLEEGKRLLESAVVDSDGNLRITLKEAAHDSDATAPVRPAAA